MSDPGCYLVIPYQVPVGMLADRFGGKGMMAEGLVLVGLSTISVSFLRRFSYIQPTPVELLSFS